MKRSRRIDCFRYATTKGMDPDLTTKKWQRVQNALLWWMQTVDHAEHIISLGVEKVAVSQLYC